MKINILGFGLMAKQIASMFYIGGNDVFIWNHNEIELKEMKRDIKKAKRYINKKEGTVKIVDDIKELEGDFTIESVIEDLEIKKSLYSEISNQIDSYYFTNTSSFSPTEIGENVNGLHFFNPLGLKIVETFFSNNKERKASNSVIDFLKENEFDVINVKENRGYIGNFILFNEISSALKLIEKYDYDLESINRIYNKLYDERDIIKIIDLIGVDTVYKILINLKESDNTIYLSDSLPKAIRKNILGRKNKTSLKEVLK